VSPAVRTGLVIGAMVAAVIGAITFAAVEGPEVVVLSTRAPDGVVHKTRVWLADADGASWIEAANPERQFLADIRRNPSVGVERDGEMRPYLATILANPEGHDRIRRLLREKYGWADWWIQHVADTSQSVAIRLDRPKNFMAPR